MLSKIFVCELKRVMRERKISAKRLSELSGMSAGHVFGVLNGDRANVTLETADRLTKPLGVSLVAVLAPKGDL